MQVDWDEKLKIGALKSRRNLPWLPAVQVMRVRTTETMSVKI